MSQHLVGRRKKSQDTRRKRKETNRFIHMDTTSSIPFWEVVNGSSVSSNRWSMDCSLALKKCLDSKLESHIRFKSRDSWRTPINLGIPWPQTSQCIFFSIFFGLLDIWKEKPCKIQDSNEVELKTEEEQHQLLYLGFSIWSCQWVRPCCPKALHNQDIEHLDRTKWKFACWRALGRKERSGKVRDRRRLAQWLTFPFPFVHHQPLDIF